MSTLTFSSLSVELKGFPGKAYAYERRRGGTQSTLALNEPGKGTEMGEETGSTAYFPD